ncbi:SusC/RagA family TonB-linked outer membrane protein [Chryseobacterium lactis]|uniref:SusC/RagA family TonB-linked outer membrane protein n=1 Tax=Chryseobacterium lactis TaxID=1241981 RepID=A0A3G6RF89_CHRLC|nr:SusC/RagA family TonB-linked outer membrane protein [Chryseobacterium lactis]AZA82426.1 SusC/RagA family TonB-linked outer membrane protein [Chryseobacterium lactis]AZB02808.1 SusC/RagA family TonB-linked outer membrane protein [Chryseobacterium lactis]PNW13898.1 SusC/RagA family TonB-linked outer membrane protein [Chryseobacterium lactis]
MKKLCRAVLLILILSISCQGLYAQEKLSTKRVNFEIGKTTASEAVGKFISENVKDKIYSNDDLKDFTVQPTRCKNELVLDCLNKILKDIPVETLIDNNSVIIRPKKNRSKAANSEWSSLSLATKDTISESSDIHIIDEITLNAGYYKVSDKDKTGSITKVSARDIENQPVTNVLSTVQGRMTGVNIIQNSGVPGAGFEIQIRGQNSLRTGSFTEQNGNVPLYVVDGVPFTEISPQKSQISSTIIPGGNINPLNTINPNDIESIEVLKDADATAIYGSRGANGVILITTKKGKSGKVRLNFSTNYGISEAISNLTLLNKDEYLNMRRTAYKNDGIATYPSNAYDVNGVWDQQNGIDWQKVLIGKKATTSNTQLSANGGSKTTSFLLSLGHNEQTTVYGQDFKYTSNNFSSNLSHRSEDNRFQINVSNLFTQQKNNVIYSDLTAKAFTLSPISPQLYNADGSLNWANNTFTNPLAAYNASYNNDTKLFQTNLNSEYKLFKDFKIKINAGLNYTIIDELALQPNTIYNPNIASGLSSANSQARQKKQDIFSFIVEPQVNWTKGWGNHNLQLLVGGTFQNIIRDTEEELGFGFESNQFISNIAAAKTVMMLENSNIEYKYAAIYGRLNYQFKNKYILNLTGRRDGSSRFGPNNRFANFGAIGAAWNFSRENLLKNLSWLSTGKLRASYGSAGSDNIGDFQFLNNYIVSSSLIYNNITGLSPSRLYNPDYSWEITKKLETAVELGFFKNRLNLSTSLYRNRSSSQLVGYQLSAVTGFSSVMANLNATIENKGLEIEITGRPLSKKDLQWESSFNISFPRNKLLSFPGLAGSSYANQYVIGQPTNIVKLYQFEGIDPSTGQYKFKDFNGDGKITSPEDRQVVADIGVKFFGGWSNSFHYKNWDLSVLFQFVKKKGWNYNSIMSLPGTMSNQPTQVLDVWSPENPSGYYMPYSTLNTNTHNLFRTSTAAVSDASFIRLKNIQLGYTLPLTEGVFRDVKIYFQGQNLWTWTKFFGVDPEALTSGFLPPLRTYSFGIQFNL